MEMNLLARNCDKLTKNLTRFVNIRISPMCVRLATHNLEQVTGDQGQLTVWLDYSARLIHVEDLVYLNLQVYAHRDFDASSIHHFFSFNYKN